METYCLKCLWTYRIPSRSEDVATQQDVRIHPGWGDNLFEAYSQVYGPDDRHCYEYHVLITYANVAPDRDIARGLASNCTNAGWRTFFAPETLHLDNQRPDVFADRWAEKLERGLLSSCHLLGVISPAHLESAYCDLEIQGFLTIIQENPSRGMVLALLGLDARDLPGSLQPYACENKWSEIQRRLSILIENTGLRLGRGPYEPLALFEPLKLWSDELRFGFGPTEGKRRIYEYYVRECMVLILKGTNPTPAALHWPVLCSDAYKSDALDEARELVAKGVSPYPRRTRGSNFPIARPSKTMVVQDNKAEGVAVPSNESLAQNAGAREVRGTWYNLVDYGGRHYVQDMEFVCRACGARLGVGIDPNDPPPACLTCGATA
jgi:hypothetical protein